MLRKLLEMILIILSVAVVNGCSTETKERTGLNREQITLQISHLYEEKAKTEKDLAELYGRSKETKLEYGRYRQIDHDPPNSDRCERLVKEVSSIAELILKEESIVKQIDEQIERSKDELNKLTIREIDSKVEKTQAEVRGIKNGLDQRMGDTKKPFNDYRDADKFMAVSAAETSAVMTKAADVPLQPEPEKTLDWYLSVKEGGYDLSVELSEWGFLENSFKIKLERIIFHKPYVFLVQSYQSNSSSDGKFKIKEAVILDKNQTRHLEVKNIPLCATINHWFESPDIELLPGERKYVVKVFDYVEPDLFRGGTVLLNAREKMSLNY